MDIFEKCNQRYIQDEVRDLGIPSRLDAFSAYPIHT